jgi:flagellar biosynthesis protein FlhB
MAETDSGQERTEQPTEKRLREARERGQVARSRELSGAAVVGACALALILLGAVMAQHAAGWLAGALSFDAAALEDTGRLPGQLALALGGAVAVATPLFAAALGGALVAGFGMGGWNFSTRALVPDFSRADPVRGLGRLFSVPALVEVGKALLKFAGIGLCVALALLALAPELIGLASEPGTVGIAHAASMAGGMLALLAGTLVLIAAIDVPYQWFRHRRELRMTRQELLDELKDSDGRPEVRGRIRRLQQELASRRMMEAVPAADVVVTNPTHYAVALKYHAGAMRAPRVVAKGADLIAQAIRERAAAHGVPLVEARPLARALYRSVEIGHEIPVNLYNAVAQVLTYVYQLRAFRRHGGRAPVLGALELG